MIYAFDVLPEHLWTQKVSAKRLVKIVEPIVILMVNVSVVILDLVLAKESVFKIKLKVDAHN